MWNLEWYTIIFDMHTFMCTFFLHIYIYLYNIYIYLDRHIYIYSYLHIFMFTCINTFLYIHTYLYIYTYIQIHKCIFTFLRYVHIYKYMLSVSWPPSNNLIVFVYPRILFTFTFYDRILIFSHEHARHISGCNRAKWTFIGIPYFVNLWYPWSQIFDSR